MNRLFSTSPFLQDQGIAVIRIVIGFFLIYHGQEVFNAALMKGYSEWDTFKGPTATFFVYLGKSAELIAGILLFLGLLTRVGALMVIGTLLYITFFVGHGKFWYEDQHPFMFVLFGFVFLFTGPGAWSMDKLIFNRKHRGITNND